MVMRGADEFAKLFETGQYGRLYLMSGNSAGPARFRVFVLPPGEPAICGGSCDVPLNGDAVEVHEIRGELDSELAVASGQRSVMKLGNWQQDFATLVEARCAAD